MEPVGNGSILVCAHGDPGSFDGMDGKSRDLQDLALGILMLEKAPIHVAYKGSKKRKKKKKRKDDTIKIDLTVWGTWRPLDGGMGARGLM